MFYTEEDIQPVVDAAIKVFGSQGQYHYYPSQIVNMLTITSKKYGKIWYGEVEKSYAQIIENLDYLKKTTDEELECEIVQIIPQTTY